MYEKVNPSHPDKVADRIAGALVDYCYQQQRDPRVAVEVLIGHGETTIIAESSVQIPYEQAVQTVERIAGKQEKVRLMCVPQDPHLADNLTDEERMQLATATLLGGCATTAAAIVIAIVLCLLFCSCTTTRYVPVNETRTEHHWHTDSVHQTDTIINRETTVIRELDSAAMARYGIQIGAMQRAWIVQSDRLQREVARLETLSQQCDTVRDSIPKPYPVEVIKQVPRDLTLWQRIRQSVGDFAIFLLLIFVGCKIFVKFLPYFHNPNSKE